MKRTSKTLGLTLAAAAAALLSTGCSTMCGDADTGTVKCSGVNSCKGTSSCQTPGSSCKGHNSCKNSGWVPMSKEQCIKRGGEIVG